MPQFVRKIYCVNASLEPELHFVARARNTTHEGSLIQSQQVDGILPSQYKEIDLASVRHVVSNETVFEIIVKQAAEIVTYTSAETVTYFQTRNPAHYNVATYVVTGTPGLLKVTLLE